MSTALMRQSSVVLRVTISCAAISLFACAGRMPRPADVPHVRRDALLVLTGFGYGGNGKSTLRALQPRMAADGVDLFVPSYLDRDGLTSSRSTLLGFIRDQRLSEYERLHVFAFLAGAWTLNPVFDELPPNLATVVYDRSPLQERAPAIAVKHLRLFAWLRYGSTIFDVARTPYPPLVSARVRVALLVESTPTAFIRRHKRAARAMGPLTFDCASFAQRHDDCGYLGFSHDEMYVHFDKIWPELLAFIRSGRFTRGMNRTPPDGDPFARGRS